MMITGGPPGRSSSAVKAAAAGRRQTEHREKIRAHPRGRHILRRLAIQRTDRDIGARRRADVLEDFASMLTPLPRRFARSS